ncbi:hypothetical protein GQ55_4G325600 [Panicum hallii var. hallii]|uniref:Uncharacterized protein n=1 Tax=Panicum hallii var. hallii TaxID=1504633 RepID=A0A2T7E2J4_9POAL|nr:hypothetical protein GQ55_4G325600 [Panicum hallii var. hallii]
MQMGGTRTHGHASNQTNPTKVAERTCLSSASCKALEYYTGAARAMRLRLEGHFLEQKAQGTRAGRSGWLAVLSFPRARVMQRKSQESKTCAGGGEGTSEKWKNGGDLRWRGLDGSGCGARCQWKLGEIFLPVSDENFRRFGRRGSGCVACVEARPLACLLLGCASPCRTCGGVWLRSRSIQIPSAAVLGWRSASEFGTKQERLRLDRPCQLPPEDL